jgi:hypothetical protein
VPRSSNKKIKKQIIFNEEAVTIFKKLDRARIFSTSVEEVVNNINCLWGSIEDWWYSRKVQEI